MSSKRTNVRVVIRFRPINEREKKEQKEEQEIPLDINLETGAVSWKSNKKHRSKKSLKFDSVLGPNSTQQEAFIAIAEKTCNDILEGYNGTIFVYGQTGSGKTFSMYGPENDPSNVKMMGIVPRSASYLFHAIKDRKDIEEWKISVSFLEIYNEQPRDLLNPGKTNIKVSLNKRGETIVKGLLKQDVENISQVLELIRLATKNRTTSATKMNKTSSRSHMLMRLTVAIKMEDGAVRIGTANFADLAGSEKVRKTGAVGKRFEEAKSINLSLTVLGRVINALSSGKSLPPYRESLLTHALRDSLGGNCKTTLMVAASPHIFNRDETINSLNFGSRCKLIKNKAKVNRVYTNDELMAKLQVLEKENQNLKEMLEKKSFQEFNDKQLIKVEEQLKNGKNEISSLKEEIEKLNNNNTMLENIKLNFTDENINLKNKIDVLQNNLNENKILLDEHETIVNNYKNDINKYKKEIDLLNNKISSLNSELNDKNDNINLLNNQLNNLKSNNTNNNTLELEKELELRQNKYNQLFSDYNNIKNENIHFKNELSNVKLSMNKKEDTNIKQANIIKIKSNKLSELQNSNDDLLNIKESLLDTIEKLKYNIQQEISKNELLSEEITKLKNEKYKNKKDLVHLEMNKENDKRYLLKRNKSIRARMSGIESLVANKDLLIHKNNELLNETEEKLNNTIKEKESYLDEMYMLRKLQIEHDRQLAKKIYKQEKKQLEKEKKQILSDEEFVRKLVEEEQQQLKLVLEKAKQSVANKQAKRQSRKLFVEEQKKIEEMIRKQNEESKKKEKPKSKRMSLSIAATSLVALNKNEINNNNKSKGSKSNKSKSKKNNKSNTKSKSKDNKS